MTKKGDKNGKYTPVPEDDQSDNAAPSMQPPPYSPSAHGSPSVFVGPRPVPWSQVSSSQPLLYPHEQQANRSLPYQSSHVGRNQYQQYHQPGYQGVEPPPQILRDVTTPSGIMASPLILMRPPTKVEDLKSKAGLVVCQHCRHLVYTETSLENGILSLILVGITSCGCCLLPLCIPSCKDVVHSCPSCQQDIALYSRIKEKTYPILRDE